MADAVVQALGDGSSRARIRCHELIHALAVYHDLVAVQLPGRVVVYRVTTGYEV